MKPEEKQQAIDILKRRLPEQREQLKAIDGRLVEYYDHLIAHSGTKLGDANDLHNGNELLCAVRFLRLLRTYAFDTEEVQDAIYDGEGEWKRDADGYWAHVKDGLGQPGRNGNEVYRWEPFQIFCLSAMYGPKAWISTGTYEGDRRLLDTERINPDTHEIEDLRRLCTRFILYGPRKINKSGYAAFHNVRDFMKGDFDSNIFCTANSEKQATILFEKTKNLLLQLDPVTGRSYKGQFLEYSATKIKFQKNAWRSAKIEAIPAGGKLPDGEFASSVAEDEYGSAGYTNGRSDMGQTVAVIESSMGPRREPLTIITTTASLISAGPFIEILESTHKMLLQEIEYDKGTATPSLNEDRQMMLLLEPDDWERDEDYLLTSRVLRQKINPMLGKIVQQSFYDTQVRESLMDATKKKETVSKLFNVYQGASVREWIKAEQVRPLQRDMCIDQCTKDQGWVIFVGLDFSQGDDLNTAAYLAARKHPSGRGTEFFADFDAWVKESTAEKSSIRPLYTQWEKDGWLHYSPGKVFQQALFIKRLDEMLAKGCQFMYFGYDKYQSKDPINALKAFLQTNLKIANPDVYCQVVSQLNSEFNAPTDDLWSAMFATVPYISFSNNPMWPWCFGNCMLEVDGRKNKRPVKRSQSDSCKVDPVQAIIMALDLYERYEGTLH